MICGSTWPELKIASSLNPIRCSHRYHSRWCCFESYREPNDKGKKDKFIEMALRRRTGNRGNRFDLSFKRINFTASGELDITKEFSEIVIRVLWKWWKVYREVVRDYSRNCFRCQINFASNKSYLSLDLIKQSSQNETKFCTKRFANLLAWYVRWNCENFKEMFRIP